MSLRRVWLYGIKKIPARVITGAYLSWEVLSSEGKRLYGSTVYGHGLDQRTFGMAGVRYGSSMQKCMDDLTENLYIQMAAAKERCTKNAIATERIREALENCRFGITTYAQYWVKLRPGMSASEVISLIGQPPRRSFNSGFQYWIFNYGYGSVKIYNEGGLSHWRLN